MYNKSYQINDKQGTYFFLKFVCNIKWHPDKTTTTWFNNVKNSASYYIVYPAIPK